MSVPTFTVKVPISCCSQCPSRAQEQLRKIKGVDSITIDTAKDLVMVSGSVEPKVILEKFNKWGRKAELISFRKESMESDDDDGDDNTVLNKNYYRKSDSDRGAPANGFLDYNPNKYVPRDSKKGIWRWLGKNIFGNKQRPRSLAQKAPIDNKWQFPRKPMNEFGSSNKPIYGNRLAMQEFGSSMPFYGSQEAMNGFGSLRPFNGGQLLRPISMYGRPPVPPHPMYMPRPPMLPPYGTSLPAPPSHPVNPMIHYKSYEDNYPPW